MVKQIQTDLVNGQLRTPTKIPEKVQMIKEEEAPPPVMASAAWWVAYRVAFRVDQMGGVIGGIISSTPVAVPKVATPQRVRVSQGVSQGLLIKKVQPNYPPLARQARIQGTVLLQAQISKDGTIENLSADQRTPDAGAGRDRSREAVEVQAVHAERRAGRGRHAGRGELHAVRWLELLRQQSAVRTVDRHLEVLDGTLPCPTLIRVAGRGLSDSDGLIAVSCPMLLSKLSVAGILQCNLRSCRASLGRMPVLAVEAQKATSRSVH